MDRTGGMGSTDVVEILGLSPYEGAGPWHVWRVKSGIEKDDATEEMRWGQRVEAVLIEWYGVQSNSHVKQLRDHRIRSKRDPWLWASPDGIVTTPGFVDGEEYLECKNVGSWMAHRWSTSSPDGIPDDVRVQVTIGMYCAEVDYWTVVAAIGGMPPVIYLVEYDPKLAEIAVERGREFWERFLRGEQPSLDGSKACAEYLASKWPRDEMPTMLATEKHEELAHERITAHLMGKNTLQRKKEIDAIFMAEMGPHGRLDGNGWHVTWRNGGKDGKRRMRFTGGGIEE